MFILRYTLCLVFFISLLEAEKPAGHNQPFGSKGPFLKINEVESLSTLDFFENYVKTKTPVLFRNGAKEFKATKLWTDSYLHDKAEGSEDYQFDVETTKKESRKQKLVRMNFRDFLASYRTNELYVVSYVPEFLMSDLNLPQQLQCEHAVRALDKMVMWFSSGGTKSVIHTDDYENIICVIDGIKDFIMVNSTKYLDEAEALIDHPEGAYSSADVDKVDYTKFVGIENLEYYTAQLRKGDCLYIPLKWIHQVRSFERNIAVNFWFNYEKLLEEEDFSEACQHNEFDETKTLDMLDLPTNENQEEVGEFTNFKYWLIRTVNNGNRKYEQWVNILVREHLPKNKDISDYSALEDSVREFFDTLDYDGDGEVSRDELQLDMNRLEHMAFIIEDLDQEMTRIHEEGADQRDEEDEESIDINENYEKEEL